MPIDRISLSVSGSIDQPTRLAFNSLQTGLDKLIAQLNLSIAGTSVRAGSTYTAGTADAGRVILLNLATGSTVTLPASTGSGNVYRFMVSVAAATGSHIVKVANATDIMQGLVFTVSDNTNAVLGWRTADTSDTITLNGTTTGSAERGEMITLVDAESGLWLVNGFTASTGTEATPFSATVS